VVIFEWSSRLPGGHLSSTKWFSSACARIYEIREASCWSWTRNICTCWSDVKADIASVRTRASSRVLTMSFCSLTFLRKCLTSRGPRLSCKVGRRSCTLSLPRNLVSPLMQTRTFAKLTFDVEEGYHVAKLLHPFGQVRLPGNLLQSHEPFF
jgi:hypothetical protein